jgi:hypothetical protein
VAVSLRETETRAPSEDSRWLLTRDFSLVWWSQIISQVGDGVTKLALVWFVYSVTGSPMKTTIIGLLQTLPPILFGPVFGVCVDRLSKKWIMIGSDVARALLIGAIPCLFSVDLFTVDRLYVLVFLHAIASAIFGPAMTGAVPFLVERRQFTAANALLQTTTSLGVVLGPALSGIGIAAIGSQEVLCVNAITYLGSAACLLAIKLSGSGECPAASSTAASLLRDLVEGVRFALIKQQRILLLILAASLYTFGTAAFSTLLPVFARKLVGFWRRLAGRLDRPCEGDGLGTAEAVLRDRSLELGEWGRPVGTGVGGTIWDRRLVHGAHWRRRRHTDSNRLGCAPGDRSCQHGGQSAHDLHDSRDEHGHCRHDGIRLDCPRVRRGGGGHRDRRHHVCDRRPVRCSLQIRLCPSRQTCSHAGTPTDSAPGVEAEGERSSGAEGVHWSRLIL